MRMQNPNRWISKTMFLVLPVFAFAVSAQGQESAHPAARNMADMQFMALPGMPTCSKASVQSGDPAKGGSIILAKAAAGCTFPWHWHTPTESVMMVSGQGRVEMKDAKPVTLRAGGFAQMPSKHVHQFRCATQCLLYVSSDAAFDIHYVDGDGKEISPDEALKKVGEMAAKPPK